ncbi:MAG: J domain-containing protein, partial [Myxococcota bacterium]
TARERRMAEQVDGMKTAEELVFISGIGEEATYQVLYALTATGQASVKVRGPMPEGRAFTPEEREIEVGIDRKRIEEKFRQALESDYFEILGIGLEATAYEIRTAHERLSRLFHPSRYAATEFKDLWGKLEEIRRAIDDAHDVLKDEGLRADYLDAIRGRR